MGSIPSGSASAGYPGRLDPRNDRPTTHRRPARSCGPPCLVLVGRDAGPRSLCRRAGFPGLGEVDPLPGRARATDRQLGVVDLGAEHERAGVARLRVVVVALVVVVVALVVLVVLVGLVTLVVVVTLV